MFKQVTDWQEKVRMYHLCFPDNVREEAEVLKILKDPEDDAFGCFEGEHLKAICVLHGRAILMLAVEPEFRCQGLGEALLREAEQRIKASGYHKLTIGVGTDNHYLMPGVPMNHGADRFFRNRGYVHSWGETECLDMNEDLSTFTYQEHAIGDTINGITYRWATEADLEGIRSCVTDAEEGFVQYYMEPFHYQEGSRAPVLVAEKEGQILGTLIVSLEVEGEGRGSVGCTATRTDARGQGIATNMVRLGTRFLKDSGMKEAFLGYTYTDIVRMYARAGYSVCQRYFMAVKEL